MASWSLQCFALLLAYQALMTHTYPGWLEVWACCFCWAITCWGLTPALEHRCVLHSCSHVAFDSGLLRSRKLHTLQTRSEVLAVVLAALCIASPTIEARLKELEPGRGRQAAPQQVQGAASVFAISDAVSDEQKQVGHQGMDANISAGSKLHSACAFPRLLLAYSTCACLSQLAAMQ